MIPTNHPDDFNNGPETHPALAEHLRALYATPAFDTAALDESILRLSRTRRPFRWARVAGVAAPLAAAACIALFLTLNRSPFDPADIDRDRRVTVLDAFALARAIDRAEPLDAAWDQTSDGNVDGKDADAIALSAVSLDHFEPRGKVSS